MEDEGNRGILPSVPEGTAEESVIQRSEWEVIRGMHAEGMAKKEIARRLDLDIKTVRTALRCEWRPQRRSTKKPGVLDRFKSFIAARGPEVAWNAVVLLREIREIGYAGSYPVLSRFVRPLRTQARIEPVVRYETAPGQQAQVDWGEMQVWLGETRTKIHLFVMVLGYSRRIFARAYLHERIGNLLDGHDRAFEHFGGCPRTVLYDNPRTIVTKKSDTTGEVTWNRTFRDRIDYYGVEPRLCRYYRAQTKGKVENGIKYVKHNALAGRRFASLDALNEMLERWCVEIADARVHGTTREIPRDRFEQERDALRPIMRRPPAVGQRREQRKVATDATVTIETNTYPAPFEWIGRQIDVIIDTEQIQLTHDAQTIAYTRIRERYKAARWTGAVRAIPPELRAVIDGPPRFDPAWLASIGEVESRSLAIYGAEVSA